MKALRGGRPSPAILIAVAALVFALGGSAIAGSSNAPKVSKSTVKKVAKKIANKTAKKQLTANIPGSHVNVADNATNATNANHATSADSATNATHADTATTADTAKSTSSMVTWSKDATENSFVSLAKTGSFELLGICDATGGDFSLPPGAAGATLENNGSQTIGGTSYVIVNRGASPAFLDSDDDDDYKLETNEGGYFNYQDNGDGGGAMAVDGAFIMVPAFGNLLADPSNVNTPNADDDSPFAGCHFAGGAFVG